MGIENKFEINSCERIIDISSHKDYKKLNLTASQKIQFGGLLQQLPALLTVGATANAYVLNFPEGLPAACHLMWYKAGGVGTPIQGADGKIVAHASLQEASAQAAVLGAFSAMAMASGQYFLSQINNELKSINKTVDQILEFLYGDKKAELMAEVSFTQYAYQHYNSIMDHNEQRIATIASLQEAKKVAMKDIEFYMEDLNAKVDAKRGDNIEDLTVKTQQTKECLELSMQLYVMASILEVYYSQNDDAQYIDGVEDDIVAYIGKCEKRILSCFSMLRTHIQTSRDGLINKLDKNALLKSVDPVIESLSKGSETDLCKSFREALRSQNRKTEYYIDDDAVYLKASNL